MPATAARRFSVFFKLSVGYFAILMMVVALIVASIWTLAGTRGRVNELTGVYQASMMSLATSRAALYKANQRLTQWALSLADTTQSTPSTTVKYDLQNGLNDSKTNFEDFLKAYTAEYQSSDAQDNLAQYQTNYEIWSVLVAKAAEVLDDTPAFRDAYKNGQIANSFDRLQFLSEGLMVELTVGSQTASDDIIMAFQRAMLIYVIISILTVLVTFVSLLLQNRFIVRPIRVLALRLQDIAEGEADLTHVLKTTNHDEMGDLCNNFNTFLARLRGIIGLVKHNMSETSMVAAELNTNAVEVAAALTQINANNKNMRETIDGLDQLLQQAGTSTDSLTGALGSLETQLHKQGDMVQESTSSVQEMIGNVTSVVNISQKRRAEADRLKQSSNIGSERLGEAAASVEKINSAVGGILEMTKAISAIAAQTNLLSMNAAIEAAHAGDAGAGFSVVANEIRTLSNNVSTQSKDINRELKAMVKEIENAWQKTQQTKEAFTDIDNEISDVTRALDEIISHNRELETGSSQVLANMGTLQTASGQIRGDMGRIGESSGNVRSVMQTVNRLGNEVSSGIGEIADGTNDITLATQHLRDINLQMVDLVGTVSREVNKFKVEMAESPESPETGSEGPA